MLTLIFWFNLFIFSDRFSGGQITVLNRLLERKTDLVMNYGLLLVKLVHDLFLLCDKF